MANQDEKYEADFNIENSNIINNLDKSEHISNLEVSNNEVQEMQEKSNLDDLVPEGVLNIKSTLVRPKEEGKKYGNRLIEDCKKLNLKLYNFC